MIIPSGWPVYKVKGIRMINDKIRIKKGWEDAGKQGITLTEPIMLGQLWVGVKWDDEDEPDWHKASALEKKSN